MKRSIGGNPGKNKETTASLKKDSQQENAVKKGYNEKSPAQPQAAFVPDAQNNKMKKRD